MTHRRLDWTRLPRIDRTGQAEAMAITPRLERASRGRTITHAGLDRLRKVIETKTGQDRLARQAEAGHLLVMDSTG